MAVLATPHMMSVLSTALFVQADVTFPGTKAFPYLLNMVTFNHGSLEFEVVARVLLSKISAKAYKEAFGKVFGIATQLNPEFENGANVLGWIVDFSDAQYTGLAHNIGDRASEVIRGCSVHYKRNVDKVAQKVCQNEPSRQLFQKIAYKIQFLERQEDVCLAFDILTGTKELQEAEAFIHLTEEELSVNTEKWVGAVNWANWWQRPRIVKMFTKCFKDMTDAVWGQCPNTTNAIKSHNKISNAKTTLLVSALEHFYRVDKRTTLRMLAAEMGIRIGNTMATKKRKKTARRRRRLRSKKEMEVDQNEQTPTSIQHLSSSEISEDENGAPHSSTSALPGPENAASKSVASNSATTLQPASKNSEEDHIGKTVWIDYYGAGKSKKSYGWCEAVVEEVNKKGQYVARFLKWPKYVYIIYDIFDESECRIDCPLQGQK